MSNGSRKPVIRSLALAPELDELARARRFVSDAATAAGFSDSRVFDITIACSEATANAIEHAPVKGEVTVKTLLYPDRLEIQVQGPGEFQAPHRLTNGHVHRGLGLPLMAQFSDHLALYSGPSGGTLVSLTFYLPGADKPKAEPIPPSIQEMLEENELVSAITSSAPVGLYVLDPDLRFRWANKAYQSFLDEPFCTGDIVGMSIADVLPGAAERGLLDELREASRTGVAIAPTESTMRSPGRGATWWLTSVVPLKGEDEQPPFDLLVLVSDETERKQTEQQLLRDQSRLESDKAVFRGAADILEEALSARGEGELGEVCIEVAEEATESEMGFVGEIGVDGRLHDIALDNPGWERCRTLDKHGQRRPSGDFEIRGLFGEVLRWGETVFTNHPSAHPASTGLPEGHPPLDNFLGVPLKRNEITFGLLAVGNRPGGYGPEQTQMLEALAPIVVEAFERKRVEQALRESEEKYRNLFNGIDQGFFIIDVIFDEDDRPVDLYYVEANEAATRIVGRDFTGQRLREIGPDYEEYWYEMAGKVALSGESVRARRWSEPDRRWYNFFLFRIGGPESRRIGNIFIDVTETISRETRTALLAELGEGLAGLDSEEEIVRLAGEKLGGSLGISAVYLADVGEERDHVRFTAGWRGDAGPPLPDVVQVADLLTRDLCRASPEGRAWVVRDTETDERVHPEPYRRWSLRSSVAVPYVGEGRPTYVLGFLYSRPREFEDAEIAFFEQAAALIFPRIKQARAERALYDDMSRRKLAEEALKAELTRSELLRAMAAKSAETSDVRALAAQVLELCRDLLGAKTGLVHEADEQTRMLRAVALSGYPDEFNRVVSELAFDDAVAPSAIAYREDIVLTQDSPAVPAGVAERERLAGITHYRWIALPIHVNGETTGALGMTFEERRPFTPREIDLLQAVADQLGVGMARARAEAAFRQNEEKYRDLFESIDQGFFIMDVLFDEGGRATDVCVVEANPAATRMLGRELAGCHLREIAPGFDQQWYDAFGQVAVTGESVSMRGYSELDDRWYDLYVFRLGEADSRRVGNIFLDVTDEVRIESNLRLIADVDTILSGSLPADEIVASVGVKLGEYLAVDNFVLAEAEEEGDRGVVRYAWRHERAVELLRKYRLSELNGSDYWRAMHSGEPFVVRDTRTDPRTDSQRHQEFGVGAYVVVPFDRDGRWKYLVSVDTRGPRDWSGREVSLVKEVAGRVIARIERARAEEELLRSRERYAFLLRFTDSMRPLTDASAILSTATRLLGRHLNIDRCAYAELQGDELIVLGQYARRVEPLPARIAIGSGAGPGDGFGPVASSTALVSAMRRGEPMAVTDVETDHRFGEGERAPLREARTRALSGAVVMRDRRPVASIACHSTRPRPWSAEELELIQEVAERTWAAAERVRAETALRESEERHRALAEENERLFRQQLHIAEHLQMALLNIPSDIGRVRLGHLYRSATEMAKVGGDFYDVFGVKDGNIAILMGDVAGHGIQAARTGTLVKDVVHAFTHQSLRTHEVLRRTNLLLIEKDLPGFVTLFLGILDPDAGILRYSSAGHPESMVRRVTGEVEMLGCGTSPLGVYPDAAWRPHEIELRPGEVLLLYSDGVTEARRDKELFGEKRLERLIRRKRVSVGRLPHLILDQVLAFSGGNLQDDAAVLALSLTEEAGPPAPETKLPLDGQPGGADT